MPEGPRVGSPGGVEGLREQLRTPERREQSGHRGEQDNREHVGHRGEQDNREHVGHRGEQDNRYRETGKHRDYRRVSPRTTYNKAGDVVSGQLIYKTIMGLEPIWSLQALPSGA